MGMTGTSHIQKCYGFRARVSTRVNSRCGFDTLILVDGSLEQLGMIPVYIYTCVIGTITEFGAWLDRFLDGEKLLTH